MDRIEDSLQLQPIELLQKAREYCTQSQYGKSCSFYLLLLHNQPQQAPALKDEFLYVFTKWLKKLLSLQGLEDFLSFVQTTVEVCQAFKIDIISRSSELLLQSDYILEAVKLLTTCRDDGVKRNYDLEENIEQLFNFVIDRWHFRMLNDKKRNLAYNLAIKSAFEDGHRSILDVGSGTGIFSLFASQNNFEKVISCEASPVMCDIQRHVLKSNTLKPIQLVEKMSNEMQIGVDIKERVSVLVTEIFDCGLLGERVLSTLKHAWDDLLMPEKSTVIPQSATVFGVCIECEELRRHSRYRNTSGTCVFYGRRDPGDENDQPYTTEKMRNIKSGYKALSNPFLIKTFNFNNKSIGDVIGERSIVGTSISQDGILDAVMVYFTLNLTSKIKVNSQPDEESCWEQAIYNIGYKQIVKKEMHIDLEVTCCDEYLDVKLADNLVSEESNNMTTSKSFNIDRRIVSRLNDDVYTQKFSTSIGKLVKCLGQQNDKLSICMIGCDMSLYPIELMRLGQHEIYLVEPSSVLLEALLYENGTAANRIKALTRPLINSLSQLNLRFDLVISEPVDPSGLIKENFIEDMTAIRSLSSSSHTKFLPSRLDIFTCIIESDQLLKDNQVISDHVTLGLKIAQYMNQYRVSNHPDVEVFTLDHTKLSSDVISESIDLGKPLNTTQEIEAFSCTENTRETNITRSGIVTGLVSWFDMHLLDNLVVSTRSSEKTHWHQLCMIFERRKHVSTGQPISLKLIRNKSNLHFDWSEVVESQ